MFKKGKTYQKRYLLKSIQRVPCIRDKMKGMVHHKFFTVFSQAGESFSQGLGQLSVNFVSWISNKNPKQKNYIYCWLFIMLLLKGFSYPMRKKRESEGTSEIRQISQRRAAV